MDVFCHQTTHPGVLVCNGKSTKHFKIEQYLGGSNIYKYL
jgi:hypothetical protein